MKPIVTVTLLLVSTSPLAIQPEEVGRRPDCSLDNSCRVVRANPNSIAAVPEPGTLALIGLGMAGLVVARKRKS